MRTTVDLRDDAYRLIKELAAAKQMSMGDFISESMMTHYRVEPQDQPDYTGAGFLAIKTAGPITSDDVKRLEEEEDEHKWGLSA